MSLSDARDGELADGAGERCGLLEALLGRLRAQQLDVAAKRGGRRVARR